MSRISHTGFLLLGAMKMFNTFSKPPALCATPGAVPKSAGPPVRPKGMARLGDGLPCSPGTSPLSYKSCAHHSLQQPHKHVSTSRARTSPHQPWRRMVQPGLGCSACAVPHPWQQLCSLGCSADASGARHGAVCRALPSACSSLVVSR